MAPRIEMISKARRMARGIDRGLDFIPRERGRLFSKIFSQTIPGALALALSALFGVWILYVRPAAAPYAVEAPARRSAVRRQGVTANCLHPGFVATRFGDQSGGVISRFVGLAKLFAIPPEKGAETIIYLASSAAVTETTGVYFYKCHAITPSHAARDDRAVLWLWERSAALASLKV
jgi:hypothetical protein